MKTRVLLADDHRMFRQALRSMLADEADFEIVAEVSDGVELLQAVQQAMPDIVVMDIGMPNMNGIEATRLLLQRHPKTKIIALSAVFDRDSVLEMMKAGASGYILKTAAGDELKRGLKAVRTSGKYFCPVSSNIVMESIMESQLTQASRVRLSSRERQVLQMVAEGKSSSKIAEQLHVALATVNVHRRNIMRKLDLHSAVELTKYAIRNGMTNS